MELSHEVDGVRLPARIGGHPALDLVNTYAGWSDSPSSPLRGDYLKSYRHLVLWTREAALVGGSGARRAVATGSRDPAGAVAVLTAAAELRDSVHAVVTLGPGSRRKKLALDLIDGAARDAVGRATLVDGVGWVPAAGLTEPIDALALAAVDLVTRIPSREVGACPGEGCGWVFSDPAGRRRWCRMEWCGNRAKQRAHAARSRQDRSQIPVRS